MSAVTASLPRAPAAVRGACAQRRGAVATRAVRVPSKKELLNMLPQGLAGASLLATLPARAVEVELVLNDVEVDIVLSPVGLFVSGSLLVGLLYIAVAGLVKAAAPKGPTTEALSASDAYDALENEPEAVLVDIRASKAIKTNGSPDIRATGKRLILNPLTKFVKDEEEMENSNWIETFDRLRSVKPDSKVILIDSDGSRAEKAAEAYQASSSYDLVYYVEGGVAEWQEAQLPYKEAFQGLDLRALSQLDLNQIAQESAQFANETTDKLVETYEKNPTLVNGVILGAAAAGSSTILFTEIETILQIVGVLGAARFLATSLLFADDRERTLFELKELFSEKIAAGEASADLQRLADTVVGSTSVRSVEAGLSEIVDEALSAVEDPFKEERDEARAEGTRKLSQEILKKRAMEAAAAMKGEPEPLEPAKPAPVAATPEPVPAPSPPAATKPEPVAAATAADKERPADDAWYSW